MLNVRLIIVDDDAATRAVLRLLAEEMGAEVVAEADNGQTAIEQAVHHPAQLMLLDVSMPVMGGFLAARYLRAHLPQMQIIFMSQHSQKAYADQALELGAKGYLVKAGVAADLGPAIQKVLNGETFVSSRVELVRAHP